MYCTVHSAYSAAADNRHWLQCKVSAATQWLLDTNYSISCKPADVQCVVQHRCVVQLLCMLAVAQSTCSYNAGSFEYCAVEYYTL
jgi:hypothetical protein